MAAQVLSFFQRSPRLAPRPTDWSQQELAEFYRVESALIRAGIRVGTDRGMSDENEPWFVFYRSDDGEVVIHFARIDGEYLIAGPAYEEIARGFDFTALVRNLVARHPMVRRADSGSNLSIHPAALLVAVVGTAFFKTGEARAGETGASNAQSGHSRPVLLSSSSNAGLTGVAPINMPQGTYDAVQLPANQAVLVLAAALLASDYGVDTASLDPAVRSAIASAAAALDFGDAPASSQTNADTDTGTLVFASAHAITADNTPVQNISSVLSLVAILSSMPQSASVTTDAAANGVGVGQHEQVSSFSPPTIDAANANWALDVRLNFASGGLPSVEAVQLVRGILGEQKVTVIEVDKLPDVLANIVERGTHYSTTPTSPDVGSLPNTPTDNGSTPPAGETPIDQPITPETPQQPKPQVYASADMVKQFIEYFIAHTSKVDIVVNGAEIIILDSRVLHDMTAINHLDSMTFDFTDGSSISLVGDHSSFLHDGNLV